MEDDDEDDVVVTVVVDKVGFDASMGEDEIMASLSSSMSSSSKKFRELFMSGESEKRREASLSTPYQTIP